MIFMDNVTFGIMLLQIVVILIAVAILMGFVIAVYLAKIYKRLKIAAPLIQPEKTTRVVPSPPVPAIGELVRPSAAGDVVNTRDLNASVHAIAQKYGIDAVTLATRDGLVVAGSGTDAQDDAATYSHMYTTGENPAEQGVQLFGIPRPGQELVGIVRAQQQIPESRMKEIEDDVKKVLDRWL
jgi:hypothetical protein